MIIRARATDKGDPTKLAVPPGDANESGEAGLERISDFKRQLWTHSAPQQIEPLERPQFELPQFSWKGAVKSFVTQLYEASHDQEHRKIESPPVFEKDTQ